MNREVYIQGEISRLERICNRAEVRDLMRRAGLIEGPTDDWGAILAAIPQTASAVLVSKCELLERWQEES